MNRYTRWAFALALLPVAACSSNAPMTSAAAPASPPVADVDQMFVNAAADSTEVDAGQLAATKARNPRIKQYGATVVADHNKAAQQLMTLTQSKSITITPNTSDPSVMAKLQADAPAAFDRDYMRGQVGSQQAAVQLFQDEAANGQDADIKAFAQQTLPTVQQHLTMARQISGIRAPTAAKAAKTSKAAKTVKS